MDDSGSWGRGRLFDALSRLCPAAPVHYSLASQAGELELGSLHVISCADQNDSMDLDDDAVSTKVSLGLLVCQHRNKSDGNLGPINMKRLQAGLWKACKWAASNSNATVHLPRIGATIPGTNYYSIERLIRGSLGKAHTESYIYYFARGGGGGSHTRALASSSSSISSSPMAHSRESPAKKATKLSLVDEALPVAQASDKNPIPMTKQSKSTLRSKKVALYRVSASMQQKIRQSLAAVGYELCSVLDEAEIVITSQRFDADETLTALASRGVQLADARSWGQS